MSNPTHTPDPDDLRELCGLVRCLRAWAHTNTDEHDDGRDHILYPMRQQRPDTGANEGPLWAAISVVLDRNGFGHYS